MHRHQTAAILAAAAALFALTACSAPVDKPAPSKPADPAPASSPAATPSRDPDAAREAAGLPPEPKGTQRQAFLNGLDAIDKDIVHGKDDKAISRGIDTCGAIKSHPGDIPKQVEQTEKRWTSPTHPEGHGQVKAAQILAVVHTTICPTY